MNKLKEKVRKGELVVKVGPRFRAPALVEYIGALGFDAVFLDCERGNFSMDLVEDMARAARVAGIASVVRPEDNLRHLTMRYLDCGVDGIMVPHVNTALDARLVVEAATYGRYRGPWVGAKEYQGAGTATWSIDDKLIVVQIESPRAIENLPAILKVEGIDLFYIGYNDLASEMGLHGQYDHPKLRELCDRATKTILDAGKRVGTTATFENIRSLIDAGVTYVLIPVTSFVGYGAAHFRSLMGDKYPAPAKGS